MAVMSLFCSFYEVRLDLELVCSELPFCVDFFFSVVEKNLAILVALKKTSLLKS